MKGEGCGRIQEGAVHWGGSPTMARVRKAKVESVAEQIASLSAEEVEALLSQVPELVERALRILALGGQRPDGGRSVMELKGVGKEFWRAIDVEAYLDRERSSWPS